MYLVERFYIGLHQPSDARHFVRCCIHIGRVATRQKPLGCEEALIDSQAFMKLNLHGRYPESPEAYARKINRAARLARRVTAVTEDYMCEPFVLARTGLTPADHQRLTIERYDAIRRALRTRVVAALRRRHPRGKQRGRMWRLRRHIYLMPVLQGYKPHEYVDHIRQYGARLRSDMWVGVGSICKRNRDIDKIAEVLIAIKAARPDLRLHAFGLKLTALESDLIRSLLYSADSMAWSYAARRQGRNANDWHEAEDFNTRITNQKLKTHGYQHSFL